MEVVQGAVQGSNDGVAGQDAYSPPAANATKLRSRTASPPKQDFLAPPEDSEAFSRHNYSQFILDRLAPCVDNSIMHYRWYSRPNDVRI